jgi:hypothetical protein
MPNGYVVYGAQPMLLHFDGAMVLVLATGWSMGTKGVLANRPPHTAGTAEVLMGARALYNHFNKATQKKELLQAAKENREALEDCLNLVSDAPSRRPQNSLAVLAIDGRTRMWSQVISGALGLTNLLM